MVSAAWGDQQPVREKTSDDGHAVIGRDELDDFAGPVGAEVDGFFMVPFWSQVRRWPLLGPDCGRASR